MARSASWCVALPCLTLFHSAVTAAARVKQAFQINDSVQCETAEQALNPRHLQTRKCLDGHAERLVRLEGVIVLLLFLFGFMCYRVRICDCLRCCACTPSLTTFSRQSFFYLCRRIKSSIKLSSAVHPMLTAAAAAEAEEGTHTAGAPALKGRPRGRAANRSALEVLTAQAAIVPAVDS